MARAVRRPVSRAGARAPGTVFLNGL